MEEFGARRSLAMHGMERGLTSLAGDPGEDVPADDPLGDEAAFPSTWQHLASAELPRDY